MPDPVKWANDERLRSDEIRSELFSYTFGHDGSFWFNVVQKRGVRVDVSLYRNPV